MFISAYRWLVTISIMLMSSCCYAQDPVLAPSIPPVSLISADAKFYQNISYGKHPENVLDIFLPHSGTPASLVIYIHGGGFTGGDKAKPYARSEDLINTLLSHNIAFASINYRLLRENDGQGILKCMNDSKRALQFIRYYAQTFQIEKERIVLMGGSAGAGTSLWIGLQDDMADPQNADPVLRESTRVQGIVALLTQASYDVLAWDQDVFHEYLDQGFSRHDVLATSNEEKLLKWYGFAKGTDFDAAAFRARRDQLNMLLQISKDDPEMYVANTGLPYEIPASSGALHHHPLHAKALMDKAAERGTVGRFFIPKMGIDTRMGETAEQFIIRTLSRPSLQITPAQPPFELEDAQATFYENIRYGPSEENTLDLFLPRVSHNLEAVPLVIYIHGGGFVDGDKAKLYTNEGDIRRINTYLSENIAFATINYRLLSPKDTIGVLKCLNDSKRALQFLRYHSKTLNIDKERVLLMGASAGAGTGLWIGLHDEMADKQNPDPVLRESTRVKGIVAIETQASYDVIAWPEEVFKEYKPLGFDFEYLRKLGTNEKLLRFFGYKDLSEIFSTRAKKDREQLNMLQLMSKDDPEIYAVNAKIPPSMPGRTGEMNHHPFHVKALMDRASQLDLGGRFFIPKMNIDTRDGEDLDGFVLRALRPRSRPNVVYVMADQWRADAVGYAGNPDVITPNIDKLASESIVFHTAVSVSPVCSPHRASLLTGQYPLTHGVFQNDRPLPNKAYTMGEIFKDAGYRTGYIGKWHLNGRKDDDMYSSRKEPVPKDRRQGFDYWKVAEVTHNYNHSVYFDEDDKEHVWPGYDAFAQTDSAISFIKSNKDHPFLLVLSWGPPHNPYPTAPEEFRKMYDPRTIRVKPNVPAVLQDSAQHLYAAYYAHCTALDKAMGDLVEAIEKEGVADNTIFVFTSDHGDMLLSRGANNKQQPWDESIKVPLLMRYPAVFGREQKNINQPINTPDILPTLLGLSHIKIPATVQGSDFSEALKGREKYVNDGALIVLPAPFGGWKYLKGGREYRAIRTARYTYARDLNGPWLLYDNERDPHQLNNLVGKDEHAILQHLDEILNRKLKETRDEFLPADEYMRIWNYKYDGNDGERPASPYQNNYGF